MEADFAYFRRMTDPSPADDPRQRILSATAALIAAGGRDAATTRSIAEAAGVQAPTIYRLFGDKRGLLGAVAEEAMAAYMADKAARPPHPDPLQDLREGWDMHIAFGLSHPGLFAILSSDPRPPTESMAAGQLVLQRRIKAIALAGRLRVSEERALGLLQAMGIGTVLTLLGQPEASRDPGLPIAACEAVIKAITGEVAIPAQTNAAASALRAALPDLPTLTAGEKHLMDEWLRRIADASQ